MKKFLGIIFSAVYMFLSTGFVLSAHYCQGELQNLGFIEHKCCCADMSGNSDEEPGCCNNEEFIVNADLDEQFPGNFTEIVSVFSGYLIEPYLNSRLVENSVDFQSLYIQKPIPLPIYLKHFPLVFYS